MRINKSNIEKIYGCKKSSVETMELKGYKLIDELFVDSSGFGQDDELAMTQGQFKKRLDEILDEHGQITAKITGAGQFQVYVGLFQKVGKSRSRIIGNNTLRIETKTGYKIRLHETDILENKNGNYILDSGGWRTNTTKSRLNEYLPDNIRVNQKNFEWFVDNAGKVIPFEDKMVIA